MTFVSSCELNTLEYALKNWTTKGKENTVTRKINEFAPAEEHEGKKKKKQTEHH